MKANTDRESSIIWNTKYSASQNYFPFPKINWWSYYRASSKQSFNSPSQSYWNTNNQITYYYIWQPIRNNKKINKRFLKTPNPQRAISIRPNFWNFQWWLKLHFLEVFFFEKRKTSRVIPKFSGDNFLQKISVLFDFVPEFPNTRIDVSYLGNSPILGFSATLSQEISVPFAPY